MKKIVVSSLASARKLREVFFPTSEELYARTLHKKDLGVTGKFFLKIYFPASVHDKPMVQKLSSFLNRILLVSGFTGCMTLIAHILGIKSLEFISLILFLYSFIPYVCYIVKKRSDTHSF